MSPLFTSADQLGPAGVLVLEEETLWRLGEPFELWWVPGKRIRPPSKEKLVRLYVVRGGKLLRAVGEAPESLMPQVGGMWDGRHHVARSGMNDRGQMRPIDPFSYYEGGCLIKTTEIAVEAARLKALGVEVDDAIMEGE